MIAIYYLAFYYGEYKVTLEEDLEDLNTRYRIANIFPCINKLGINTNNIKAVIDAL